MIGLTRMQASWHIVLYSYPSLLSRMTEMGQSMRLLGTYSDRSLPLSELSCKLMEYFCHCILNCTH